MQPEMELRSHTWSAVSGSPGETWGWGSVWRTPQSSQNTLKLDSLIALIKSLSPQLDLSCRNIRDWDMAGPGWEQIPFQPFHLWVCQVQAAAPGSQHWCPQALLGALLIPREWEPAVPDLRAGIRSEAPSPEAFGAHG